METSSGPPVIRRMVNQSGRQHWPGAPPVPSEVISIKEGNRSVVVRHQERNGSVRVKENVVAVRTEHANRSTEEKEPEAQRQSDHKDCLADCRIVGGLHEES